MNKIVKCPQCNGSHITSREILSALDKYKHPTVPCCLCNGQGVVTGKTSERYSKEKDEQ